MSSPYLQNGANSPCKSCDSDSDNSEPELIRRVRREVTVTVHSMSPCSTALERMITGAKSDASDSGHTTAMRCPKGHPMFAKVAREMLNLVRCSQITCCDTCHDPIDVQEGAWYRCKDCNLDRCLQCTMALGIKSECGYEVQDTLSEVQAGDIFYTGPDAWSIHHTILARSRMKEADPEIAEALEAPPGAELFECHTIESTRALTGEATAWYATLSFFMRVGEVTKLVADLPPDSETIQVFESPVPVKVLMHPLRGTRLDEHIFNEAIVQGACKAQRYGRRQAVKAFLSLAMTPGNRMEIKPKEFGTPKRRARLLRDLHKRWSRRPICAALCVKVWQMYFELLGREAGQEDKALTEILRWMPVYCDRITPSALVKVLTERGWELRQL